MEKVKKALVKGVLSGDTLLLSGKLSKNSPNSIPEEPTIILTGIQSPKIGNSSKPEDEPYGFESREFLRKLLIGKVINYKIDFTQNERNYGQIYLDEKNIGIEVVRNGLGKTGFIPKSHEKIYNSEYWKELKEGEEEAKKAKLNIWSDDDVNKHKRNIHLITDDSFDLSKLKEYIKTKKELDVIIDYVFNCAFFTIYIPEFTLYSKMNLRFLAIPNQRDEILYKQGKAYVERIALHQNAKLIIYSIDERKNIVGDIKIEKGLLVGQILKEGYAKIYIGSNISNEDLNLVKSFQNEARNNRLRIWKNEKIIDNKEYEKEEGDELGEVKCIMVHSGDSISVKDKNGNIQRIFLSNLKAPSLAKLNSDESDKPWAFQAKEYLRKKLIGKEIKCEFNYGKNAKIENTNKSNNNTSNTINKKMRFYTVYYHDDKNNERCLNVDLIENGYANIVTFKIEDGEPTKELDNMRIAEQNAKDKKNGIYSPKTPIIYNYSDLVGANKSKKKEFVSFLLGLKNIECTVEFCFSGYKLKLRIEKKQCYINFGMIGIKTFTKDKNNTEVINKYYQEALDYVNEIILQRDGFCDILTADRMGNYFGNFYFNKKNFALELLKKGYAVVDEQNKYSNINVSEFLEAEKFAKEKKIGLWENEGLAHMLKFGDSYSGKYEEIHKDIKLRITEQIDMHNFYVNFLPNKELDKIENILSKYDEGEKKEIKLELPIKINTLCAARFPDDDRFYRGIIRGYIKKNNEYKIEFIDYGNVEYLKPEDLIKLDSDITSIEPQAKLCELAYLEYSKNSMKKSVDKYPDFIDIDNTLNGKLCYDYNDNGIKKHGIIIYLKDNDIYSTYHAGLLKIGYAKIDRKKKLPDYLKELNNIEDQANKDGLGLWAEDEEIDYGKDVDDEF